MTNNRNQSDDEGRYGPNRIEAFGEELDWLTVDHDDLRAQILEQFDRPKYHPSMEIIDRWESDLIEQIRSQALLARRTILDAMDLYNLTLMREMDDLTPKIRQAREGSLSFDLKDLNEWTNAIKNWRKPLSLPIRIENDRPYDRLVIDLGELKEKSTILSLIRSLSTNDDLVSVIYNQSKPIGSQQLNQSKHNDSHESEPLYENLP